MLDYILPITTYIEDFLEQTIFLNQHRKLDFCPNNPFLMYPTQKYFRQVYHN